jgi:hypothetical protein
MTDLHALDLSREYFLNKALPDLKEQFSAVWPRFSAGLAGNGSECFRFDDAISRDHDWGVDFFVWVTEDDEDSISKLCAWREDLLRRFPPETPRAFSQYASADRVMTGSDFYRKLIGSAQPPVSDHEWLRIPEHLLALATNGEVFWEGPEAGAFSEVRARLLAYYPEDVFRKKLAARLMSIAQTGQYNLMRSVARGDRVTCTITQGLFLSDVCHAVLLLNRVYAPYYKWRYRRMAELPILGAEIGELLREMAAPGEAAAATTATAASFRDAEACAERICALLLTELHRQGLAQTKESFLIAAAEEVQASIENPALRALPTQYDPSAPA